MRFSVFQLRRVRILLPPPCMIKALESLGFEGLSICFTAVYLTQSPARLLLGGSKKASATALFIRSLS